MGGTPVLRGRGKLVDFPTGAVARGGFTLYAAGRLEGGVCGGEVAAIVHDDQRARSGGFWGEQGEIERGFLREVFAAERDGRIGGQERSDLGRDGAGGAEVVARCEV